MRVVLGCVSCSRGVLEAVLGVLVGAWGGLWACFVAQKQDILILASETKAPATNLQDQAGCEDGASMVRGWCEEGARWARGSITHFEGSPGIHIKRRKEEEDLATRERERGEGKRQRKRG